MIRVTYFENPIAGFNRLGAAVVNTMADVHEARRMLKLFGLPLGKVDFKRLKPGAALFDLRIFDWHGEDHVYHLRTKSEVIHLVKERVEGWSHACGFKYDGDDMMGLLRKYFKQEDTDWENCFPEAVDGYFSLHCVTRCPSCSKNQRRKK